jgi:predicted DNA-binding protein (UPF0251 family)
VGSSETWRAWLMTGVRHRPIDARRVQGANRGLKKFLAGDSINGVVPDRPWRDFSSAMYRQAVNEAMNHLPPENQEVVKLAYFDGLSNREIAGELGMSVTGVQRRLRNAIARVNDYLEHGRSLGRRAALGLLLLLSGRRLGQWLSTLTAPAASHVVAGAILVTIVAAAPVVAPPAHAAPRVTVAVQAPVAKQPAAHQPAAAPTQLVPSTSAAAPAVKVPPITLPYLPTLPLPKVPRTPSI